MKKLFIALILFFMTTSAVFADGPKPLEISKSCTLYPVGWSGKGNFAYIVLSVNSGACGFCPQYEFVVQSLVTDKILDKKFYDAQGDTEEIKPIDKFWADNKIDFERSLKRYGLIVSEGFKKEGNFFKYKGSNFRISFQSSDRKFKVSQVESVKSDYMMVKEGKLNIENLSGKKTIYTYRRKRKNILSMEPFGCIISPLEDRSAVILKYRFLDKDGLKDEKVMIVGAHLKAGFK